MEVSTVKAILSLLALGLAGCSSMRDRYESEVAAEVAKPAPVDTGVFTEEDMAALPEPVRRHFRVCGFLGQKKMRNARLEWKELNLKRGKDKSWMKVKTRQFNSVPQPARIVLMQGRLFGLLPFEGRDKYQDGRGNLLVRALGLFTVVDSKSTRMDSSELVTVLAEALLAPSYCLQPYMRWEPVDSATARATLEYGGSHVSGEFHFNAAGECVRFTTRDRWQDGNDSAPVPWSAVFSDYLERDGIRFAAGIRALWHEQGGEFEYARGTLERIVYDVDGP
jgi:hypothetical protein